MFERYVSPLAEVCEIEFESAITADTSGSTDWGDGGDIELNNAVF